MVKISEIEELLFTFTSWCVFSINVFWKAGTHRDITVERSEIDHTVILCCLMVVLNIVSESCCRVNQRSRLGERSKVVNSTNSQNLCNGTHACNILKVNSESIN